MEIRGIRVVLVNKVKIGTDPLNHPIYEDTEVAVDNVLISPTSSEDMADMQNLTGKKAVYTLAIPKGDTNNWEDCEVRFFDQTWRTIGFPTEGIEEMLPPSWNKKVMVERYE